ncbi:MlaD family protein [Gordonia terrae]|uniref:MCE family protein n=2 Tax=Gordonia terrae TaxID=2055 RepID=A0AAD0K4N1_9ACTN|nr:MlaD family protein [Gordonia terrae]VTR09127.1 virulence factor Mce family protein [Clostridioides difficile]ANY21818.1 mammalian cell entry protein [Gordonia terrae]AWO82550.1 MCE family protein [Gordonia terrae]VTS21535.1 virulence factor Mce family protein [Gordonia terrae]GAB44750.1 Mce family protein [Gordonia terrae NBRC 100016]
MSDTRSKTLIGAEDASSSSQMWWATVSIAVVAILIATTSILYLKPPGTQTFHLTLSESGNLRAGDAVRVAGVPVGKILGLGLREDHVDVEFSVKSEVFVGDTTSVSVRMLTPIGGLYLAMMPSGTEPLREPIPQTRADVPFLVDDLVSNAVDVTDQIDTDALRDAMSASSVALDDAPGTVRSTVTDMQKVIELFARQKNQIEDLLSLSNEYLGAVLDNKSLITEVIRAYAVLGPSAIASAEETKVFADSLSILVGVIFDFLSGPYQQKLEPLLPPLVEARNVGRDMVGWSTQVVDQMRHTLVSLGELAGPEGKALIDQSGLTTRLPDVCLPVPGRTC